MNIHRYLIITLLLLFMGLAAPLSAQDIIRHPAISPDGSSIAYSWQGDIWHMDINSTVPNRLTIHEAYDRGPLFNDDGSAIAFTSGRFGNSDIFTMDLPNGSVTQVTYRSSGDVLTDWSGNNLLFTSERDFNAVEWDAEVHMVPASGGTPVRASDAFAEFATQSPNGQWIAMVRGSCRIEREAYRGSANLDIWLMNTETNEYIQLTTFNGNDYMPRWVDNNTLRFISARSGRYNIHEMSIDDSGMGTLGEQLTSEEEFGIRHFDVADNGSMVYTSGARLVHINAEGSSQDLNPVHNGDFRFDPVVYESKSDGLSGFAVNPGGGESALEIDGEIFVTENDDEKSKTKNISEHAFRDRDAAWVNDSTLVFTSDRSGNYEIYMAVSTDENKPSLVETLKRDVTMLTNTEADEMGLQISPDGSKISYVSGTEWIIADISAEDGIENREVWHDEYWSLPDDVAWSPDSKWIAYSQPDLYFNSEIFIRSADGEMGPVNVSMHPKGDGSPVWSPDGKMLAFISERNNQNYDIWMAWLTEEDWDKTQEDREEGLYFDSESTEEESEEDEEEVPVEVIIDLDNIHNRLVQLTGDSGNERNPAFDGSSEHVYFVSSSITDSRSEIYKVKTDGSGLSQVTTNGASPYGLTLAGDDHHLFYVSNGRLAMLDTSSDDAETVAFRASYKRDFEAEKRQMFDEAWGILNKGFYDPDFHGQDFQALRDQYEPLALATSTLTDFRYVFNLMLGQLNASHMGMYGGDRDDTQDMETGLLGAELRPLDSGVEVTHVVPDTPADRNQSKLNVGDIITHVNGAEITEGENVYRHFEQTEDQEVLLNIRSAEGDEREVVIRPAGSIGNQLYEQWITERRELTDEYSDGRLGYIHIRGMNMPSFERFERELMASGYGKEGIVIDVRYNGGGWTTDYLMAVLNVDQHAYTIPRGAVESNLEENKEEFREYYPYSERLPLSAWTKPSVALANESSYSNAEIFSHAYKNLGIGDLVGVETFGAVISTGGARLIDGSLVRLPYRGWYVKNSDLNMDFSGAVPDHEVHNAPDYRTGEDTQLRRAVEVLLNQLDEAR
jgi:Tol biopolymer transport system component